MNRDRGRIKWTAMMLPEHVEKLREWQHEDKIIKRPILNEDDAQLIGDELELALKRECQVRIKTWGNDPVNQFTGKIIVINPSHLLIHQPSGTSSIQLNKIISVELIG